MKLSEVDSTYKFVSADDCKDLEVFSVLKPPFSLHGIFYADGKFKRLPYEVAKTVSEGVAVLHSIPSGGRVKFKTDSSVVALFVEEEPYQIANQPLTASSGFEIFADGKHAKSVFQSLDGKRLESVEKFSSYARFSEKKWREIEVYFPLYCRVRQVMIGVQSGSGLAKSEDYKNIEPIVYYGSSITQGCCASKPSCTYQSFIERWLGVDYLNLGFSGNCKGERTMMEYIASLKMSAFVLDYDYNSSSVEHLGNTHLDCYLTVREKHPDIPIVMMSRPEANRCAESVAKRNIIRTTYRYACNRRDKNVRFIDGHTLFGTKDKDICTVEGCHPTDLGFYRIAKRVYKELISFEEFKE